MSFFFGSKSKTKPQYTGLATQTSTSNLPVTILMGKNRIAPNIIWQGDFKAHKQKQKSGKGGLTGGGKGGKTYTYSGSYQLALCWGEVGDIPRMWKDQSKETDYTKLGFSLQTGTVPQSPWGYMTTKHPDQALGYSGIAVLNNANYDLGNTNALGQHSFEVEGPLANTQVGGTGDADCADAMENLLTNELYGVPVDASILSNLMSTGSNDASYQNYCRAIGFGISPAIISQEAANAIIDRWCRLTNTAPVWTGYSLKLMPYADETITGNGVTYTPDFTVRYTINDSSFLHDEGTDPITFDRVDPADAYNSLTITIKNRNNEYNDLPVEWRDQALVDQYGLRTSDAINAYEVCEPDMAARMVALMGQRVGYIRNTYNFKLPARYCLLEPMDVIECIDPRLGTFTVLIREIDEDEDDNLVIIAEEYTSMVTRAGVTEAPSTTNDPINTGVLASDVNTPIIMQPPPTLTDGRRELWAAISGGNPIDTTEDPYWGGCQVWISTDGGVSYHQIGESLAASRMGVLTNSLPAYVGSNPDSTNTLKVNFAMSGAIFDDAATPTDAAAGLTLSYIAAEGANVEEFLSYETPTLNSTDVYWFDELYRGLGGSVNGAHAAGARFARLDTESTFKYEFPEELEGETIYVKLVSFNIWGGGLQDIADVTAYPFTISTAYTYGISVEDLNDVSGTPSDGDTLVYDSGTGTWVPGTPSIGPQPYGFAWTKKPVVSKVLAYFDSPIAWEIPSSMPDCQATIVDNDTETAAAPSAQTDFDIQTPSGSSVATMRFAASSLTATFINASTDSIPVGQLLLIVAPSNLNGMTGSITGAIKGTRN